MQYCVDFPSLNCDQREEINQSEWNGNCERYVSNGPLFYEYEDKNSKEVGEISQSGDKGHNSSASPSPWIFTQMNKSVRISLHWRRKKHSLVFNSKTVF